MPLWATVVELCLGQVVGDSRRPLQPHLSRFFLNPHLKVFIDLRRGVDIHAREKRRAVASHMCLDRGSNQQPFGE